MTEDIYWLLKLDLNPEKQSDFEALMAEMVAATLQENGAKSYEWHQSGNAIHIYERYASSDDALIHMQNFGANFAERFMSLLTPVQLEVYGPAKDDLRAALSPVGAVFHQQIGGFDR
ncbi:MULTISPECIES: putative quinol monooxygenase [unclassified Ruegeria]|uniref:putative quinol monooxygenase n=1 Tax=unclassified Ruegeria TaxID=2625375 RepID=UPI001487C3A3|nr:MULTISPECIES: antibiotic biosynthesis monooxygenase [unclassified Ruegeria]